LLGPKSRATSGFRAVARRGDAMSLIMYTVREAHPVVDVDKVRASEQTGLVLEEKKVCRVGGEKDGENSASLFHASLL
jgi:hypothetical protein